MPDRRPDQQQRADALRRFFVLDAPRERPYQRMVRLASLLFDVDHAALVTIDDGDRRLVAAHGFHNGVGGEDAVQALPAPLRAGLVHPVQGEKVPLHAEDAAADARFEGHPLCDHASVRFYASAPLKSAEGYTLGVLKVFDATPRELSSDGLTLLTDLAAMAESERTAQRMVADAEARAQRTARLDAFSRAVGTTAERFLRAEDWQNECASALQHLGEAAGAQAVQVYVNHTADGHLVAERTFAWGTQGLTPPAALDYHAHHLHRWAERFAAGQCLCAPYHALPEAERGLLDEKQARAVAAAPLFVDGTWAGFLCFDFARDALPLADAEEDALLAAAEAFGAVLERDRRTQTAPGTALAETAATPLLVCKRGAIAFANPAAARLLAAPERAGDAPAALEGTRLLDLVPAEMHDDVRAYLDRCRNGEQALDKPLRVRFLRAGAEGTDHDVRVADVQGASTKFQGELAVLLAVHDVTDYQEQIQAAAEATATAEASAELVSTLMTGLNQEVRTPLTSILGYAELLAGNLTGGDLDQVGVIRKSGQQLSRTIEAVYELAHLSGRRKPLAIAPLPLTPLLRDAERIYAPLAYERGLRFVMKPPAHGTSVLADATALTRVLGHLLTNAIQYTDEGSVEVRVRAAGAHLHVEVEDTGCGISEAFLPAAFAPFRRERRPADGASGKALQPGAGLGLTLAQLLVEQMNGHLELKSQPGQGTLCRVSLPAHAPETNEDYRPKRAPAAADGASVEAPVPRIALPSLAPPVPAR